MIILDNLPKIWKYRFCQYGRGTINAYRACRQQAMASQLDREIRAFGLPYALRMGEYSRYTMFAAPKGFLP